MFAYSSPENAATSGDADIIPVHGPCRKPQSLESSPKRSRRGPAPSASASTCRNDLYDQYLVEKISTSKEERDKLVLEQEKIQLEKQVLMLKIKKLEMEIEEKNRYVSDFEL